MHTIQLNVRTDGLAAALRTVVKALDAEVAAIHARDPACWDAPKRAAVAHMFALLDDVVAYMHAHEL